MPSVRIIVAALDSARIYAALEAAMAWAALGREVEIFFQGEAVAGLRRPVIHPADHARQAAGQPDFATLLGEVREVGVPIFVCQSGLALAGVTMEALAVEARATGLVGYLAAVPANALVVSY